MEKMIRQFEKMEDLENVLVNKIVTILQHSLKTTNQAKILLSGGNSPKGLYRKLSQQNLAWNKVQIGLVDERFVEKDSPLSNEKMIRETLVQNKASEANLTGMIFENDYAKNVITAAEKYKTFIHSNVVLLGMGNDGHTASLFPNDNSSQTACAVTDADLVNTIAPSEPVKRISLNKPFICNSENIFLMFSGQEKGVIFEKSVENQYPIHHFIPKLNEVYYSIK